MAIARIELDATDIETALSEYLAIRYELKHVYSVKVSSDPEIAFPESAIVEFDMEKPLGGGR